ncbi:hypothetical protein ACU4GD_37710 [Cupriavidus basilensis]
MTTVAIANSLHGGQMQERFHREPTIQAAEAAAAGAHAAQCRHCASTRRRGKALPRWKPANERVPRCAGSRGRRLARRSRILLPNGRYAVLPEAAAGAGYSRWLRSCRRRAGART